MALRREKQALESSVQELQVRLTDMETQLDGGMKGGTNMEGNAVEMSLKRGERERQLEVMVSFQNQSTMQFVFIAQSCCSYKKQRKTKIRLLESSYKSLER